MSKLTKAFSAEIKVTAGERAVMAVISTDAVDREGDVLIPDGCNSKQYELSPSLFFNHDYYTLPVGKCVGLKREDSRIVAKFVLAERPADHPEGEEWFPSTLLSLFQQGVVNGFSVGFEILDSRPASPRDITKFGDGCRRVISKWRLYEVSVAPMPCQQEAVSLAVSKGFINQDAAEKIFGAISESPEAPPAEVDTKSADDEKPAMVTCSKCQKEYPADDMEDVDGAMVCPECKGAKAAEIPTEEPAADAEPVKRVVRAIEPEEPAEAPIIKRVHRIIAGEPRNNAKTVKSVTRYLSKKRGALYAD
jgi:HK97 family phage prohead protease